MRLSKSKPNIKHKKIISLNLNISNTKNCLFNKKNIIGDKQNSKANQNCINKEDLDLNYSTQLDWVNSAIEIKTKNNEIIKLSLENENLFEQEKIKDNKFENFIELDNLEKYDNFIDKNANVNKEPENKMNLNKNDNKENTYMMISTKESEKFESNFKYLSNKKNKNIEIIFPENINNKYDENNEEDIVNMKSLTLFDSKKKIYKKRLNTGYLNSKKFLQITKNDNFIPKNKKFFGDKENKFLKISLNKININKNKYLKNENKTNITYNKEKQFDLSELEKKNKIFSKNINTEKTNIIKNIQSNIKKDNINSNKIQSYKFITPNKNILNKKDKIHPSTNIIKKHISQKFLLSSNNKSNLLLRNFLSQINLQKYFSVLQLNGFDNLNLLMEQMKTNMPIKDSELKKAGIKIPGDRAKILIKLEEKGNLFPFSVPKSVYFSLKNNLDRKSIDEDKNIINLRKWLKEMKMEKYLDNFIKNGYHSVELLLFQMISKNPIDNDILEFEIGIEKIGYRSRMLSILKEESKNIIQKLERMEKNINFGNGNENCGCYIY